MPATARANNRVEHLLDASAELFATRGYQATTMRDIAKASRMLPGSIYYHYPNKESLLLAVYEEGVQRLTAHVETALANAGTDPWQRLEAMLTAHIETIVNPTAYASTIIRVLPDAVPSASAELIRLRNQYEVIMRDLVDALRLPPDVDKRLIRLFVIGAVNHVPVWFQEDKTSAAQIAQSLVQLVRGPSPTQVNGRNS